MKNNPPHSKTLKPSLLISSVGFKLTPALDKKVRKSLQRLHRTKQGIVRIRAKLRLITNGPRKDSFQVRLRIEKPGYDLVSVDQGYNLYQLIPQVVDKTISRYFKGNKKRKKERRSRLPLQGIDTTPV